LSTKLTTSSVPTLLMTSSTPNSIWDQYRPRQPLYLTFISQRYDFSTRHHFGQIKFRLFFTK